MRNVTARFRPGVAAVCVALLSSCGGHSSQSSPVSPSKLNTATSVAVTVSLPAGHAASFTPGERSQLRAIATYSDLSTGECTAAAQWVSSNDLVIRLSGGHPGEIVSVAGGDAIVRATCGTATGQLTVTVGRGVRIGGGMEAYPHFILTGGNFFLTATIINADGSVYGDCGSEAVWTSSNPAVATIQSTSKRLQQRSEGEATITAACALATGQLLVRIGHYVLSGVVRAADGSPVGGALIDKSLTASDGSYSETQNSERPDVRVSSIVYETLVQAVTWNREPTMTQDLVLSPIPGVFLQGEGKLCNSGSGTATYEMECKPAGASSQDLYRFTVPYDGMLRLATHWSAPGGSEIDHDLIADLKCDGARVKQMSISSGLGGGFSVSATARCHDELTLTNGTVVHVLPYEYTLSLQ